MSLRTRLLHFSFQKLRIVPYANDFYTHAQNFQFVGCCGVFQNKVVTLNNGKFAVFDDALDTFVRFRMCFAFDA